MALIGMIIITRAKTTHNKWVKSTHLQFDTRVVCHLEGQSNDTRVRVKTKTTHLFLQCG